jgi:hypothetical protein
MWHKFLLVIGILLVGCSLGDAQGSIESQPDLSSAVKTDSSDNSQVLESTSQPTIESQPPVTLENLGPAPELTNEVWLNTDRPLRLADLRGTVVLLEMWTFG